MKKVSIIVPVFHVEKFLEKCVDSLLEQSYSNIEIVLVDDGSDDTCPAKCDWYVQKDSRVICIHKKNGGQNLARQAGVQIASGDFFMFVDADDWLEKNTVELCINAVEQYDADVVCFGYKRIYEYRAFDTSVFPESIVYENDEIKKLQRRLIGLVGNELTNVEAADRLAPMWGKLYKRDVVFSGKWVSEREVGSSEDALFNLYAFKMCKRFVYINKFLYCYRKTNDNATTRRYRCNLINQWIKLFEYFQEYINNQECTEDYLIALNNRVALSMIGIGLNESAGKKSFIEKVKALKNVLSKELWVSAYSTLDYKYFPHKWKIFFYCCKFKWCGLLVIMIESIEQLRSIREK